MSVEADLSTFLWKSTYRDVNTVLEIIPFCDILIGSKTLNE